MHYFIETGKGDRIRLAVKSHTSKETILTVDEAAEFVVSSNEWVELLCEEVSQSGQSFGQSLEAVERVKDREFRKVADLYPNGMVWEPPTVAEVQEILDYANKLREEDVESGDVESPFYSEKPVTLEDIMSEVYLCRTTRKS
jgi:hypothetical protein